MKLSDVKGERTLDVIADIIDPIANIAADEEAAVLFRRERLPEGMTPTKFALKRIKRSLPVLIKNHKADIITILSTIEGVDPAQYSGALNMVKLIKDLSELIIDEMIISLFTSAQTESSSGSAPENIEEAEA